MLAYCDPILGRGREVRQHLGAVQALPVERIVGQTVVLVPADLDREEVLEAGLLDQLRQVPGVAEHVREPEDRDESTSPKCS